MPTEVHGHVNQQSRVKDKNLGAILENVVPLFVLLAQFHTLQHLVQLFPELLRPHLYKKCLFINFNLLQILLEKPVPFITK